MARYVVFEGNVGAGKSFWLERLKSAADREVVTFPEPVDKWSNFHRYDVLSLMYEDPQRHGYTFQHYALETLLEVRDRAQDACMAGNVVLTERSIYSSVNCFAELFFEKGYISDLQRSCLRYAFERAAARTRKDVDLVVYVRTSPEVCWRRIRARNRGGEGAIDVEYLQELHRKHETMLIEKSSRYYPSTPVLIVDGNDDGDGTVMKHLREILAEIKHGER